MDMYTAYTHICIYLHLYLHLSIYPSIYPSTPFLPRIIIGLYLVGCRLLAWAIVALRWRLGASNVARTGTKWPAGPAAKVHADAADEVAHSNVVPWHLGFFRTIFGGWVGYAWDMAHYGEYDE